MILCNLDRLGDLTQFQSEYDLFHFGIGDMSGDGGKQSTDRGALRIDRVVFGNRAKVLSVFSADQRKDFVCRFEVLANDFSYLDLGSILDIDLALKFFFCDLNLIGS